MKILFDGASSYIGFWIIKELVEGGHEVIATFRKKPEEYEGLRAERAKQVQGMCKTEFSTSFGDERFIEIIRSSDWDLFCHHAADATNPRAQEFDWLGALNSNTKNLDVVLDELLKKKCTHLVITGSLYEQNEGAEGKFIDACNPYGLSKGLTWEVFKYSCRAKEVNIGKFVIPISFGPLEDPKFHSYLAQSWLKGEVPTVKTPKYTRDDIPVTLLAKVYKKFVEDFVKGKNDSRIDPSFYVMVRKDFAQKFADEMKVRFNLPCPLKFFNQTEFPEPEVKINSTKIKREDYGWDEKQFWDDIAKFYISHYSK